MIQSLILTCFFYTKGEAQSQHAEYVADAVKEVMHVTPGGGEMKSAADSLLPIIQSQRERFRLRAQELEAVSKHFIYLFI